MKTNLDKANSKSKLHKGPMAMIVITIIALIILILAKDQWQSVLLNKATYGMPALIEDGHVDKLFIGSSMFRQGIDITLFEDENVYVLAYNGNNPVLEYIELKYLIDHGVTIDELYVDMYAYSACASASLSDEKLLMEVDLPTKWEIYQSVRESCGSEAEAFWRFFVTANNDMLFTWIVSNPVINSRFDRGGSLQNTLGLDYESLSNMSAPGISGYLDEAQIQAISNIIELAQDNEITLYWVETPKYITVTEYDNYVLAMENYLDLFKNETFKIYMCSNTIDEILNCCSEENTIFNDANSIIPYSFGIEDASNYIDTIHMSSKGRIEFTEIIQANYLF